MTHFSPQTSTIAGHTNQCDLGKNDCHCGKIFASCSLQLHSLLLYHPLLNTNRVLRNALKIIIAVFASVENAALYTCHEMGSGTLDNFRSPTLRIREGVTGGDIKTLVCTAVACKKSYQAVRNALLYDFSSHFADTRTIKIL